MMDRKTLLIAEHRERCVQMIEQHERDLEALNKRYGAPPGWRRPGAKTKAERIAELDERIERYR